VGRGERAGTMYPMSAQTFESEQFGYLSGNQIQENSRDQWVWDGRVDNSNMLSRHDIATGGNWMTAQDRPRYENQFPRSMTGVRSGTTSAVTRPACFRMPPPCVAAREILVTTKMMI
jgi:hypothetical protein